MLGRSHRYGQARQNTGIAQPVESAESLRVNAAAPAQVGQSAIARQAHHDHRVGAVPQNLKIARLQCGPVGEDQEEPVGMIPEELCDAREQKGLAAGDHECHHAQPHRFVHNSIPVGQAESLAGAGVLVTVPTAPA